MFHANMLDDVLESLQDKPDTIIVLENDLYRREPSKWTDKLLDSARIIVIDSLESQTTLKSDVLLPAATFAESDGTLVNNEGRAQRFFKVLPPDGDIQESWRWLRDIMIATGRMEPGRWSNLDEVIVALEAEIPEFQRISQAAPKASFRIANQKIPRQLHRYSGRTAMNANVTVHEPAPPGDSDSPLSFSMEGYQGQPPAGLASFFWAPGWNSYQAVNRFQSEIYGPLRGGPAGVRLIGADADAGISYFKAIPEAFQRRADEFLILPAYSIFGSEELSIHAPGIAERAAAPFLGIGSSDAIEFGISAGQELEVVFGGFSGKLPAKLNASLPRGVVIIPVGLPGLVGVDLPAWGKIRV